MDNHTTLCLAPLTERVQEMCSEEISDASGYFLYELRQDGDVAEIAIIAQVKSDAAALRLRAMLGMV